mmetsp:Transcript_24623/g.38259  ORF Transcript_24623/g.38259 Transcript_24623/m.38259 type:complete len:116 (-) Transcript_24623:491-838(-)
MQKIALSSEDNSNSLRRSQHSIESKDFIRVQNQNIDPSERSARQLATSGKHVSFQPSELPLRRESGQFEVQATKTADPSDLDPLRQTNASSTIPHGLPKQNSSILKKQDVNEVAG